MSVVEVIASIAYVLEGYMGDTAFERVEAMASWMRTRSMAPVVVRHITLSRSKTLILMAPLLILILLILNLLGILILLISLGCRCH